MNKRFWSVCLAIALVLGIFTFVPLHASAASEMTTSEECLSVIKELEGFSKTPYKDTDGNWKDVSMLSSYQDITKIDTYNTIRIKPVTTTAIRMIVTVREGKAATGILRWIVCNEQKETVEETSQASSKHNNIFTGIWEWFLKFIGKNK